MTNKEVGNRLTLIEQAFGKTGVQMAEQLGLDGKAWSKYKTGRVGLPWQVALKIRNDFGCTTDWIFSGQGRESNRSAFNARLDAFQALSRQAPPTKLGRPRKAEL